MIAALLWLSLQGPCEINPTPRVRVLYRRRSREFIGLVIDWVSV